MEHCHNGLKSNWLALQPTANTGTAAHSEHWHCRPQRALALQPTASTGTAAHSQHWHCSPQPTLALQPTASTGTAAHCQHWHCSPQPTLALQPTANSSPLQPTANTEFSLWRCTPSFLNFRISLTFRQLWLREEISRCALDSVLNEFHSRTLWARQIWNHSEELNPDSTVLCSGLRHRHCTNWATQTSVVTKGTAVPVHAVREFVYIQLHSSVTFASRSGRFTAGEKKPWYLLSRKLSGPSPGLDVLEEGKISCTCRHSNPGHSDTKPTELFKISHNSAETAAPISQVSAQRSK